MEPFTPQECQQVMDEVGDALRPTRVLRWDCTAWRLPHRGLVVDLAAAHGLPVGDGQVVRYGPGGAYAWHTDGPGRTTSHVVALSDPGAYEGGALEVDGPVEQLGSGRGSITMFRGSLRHRVTPVTAGERWSLVLWS